MWHRDVHIAVTVEAERLQNGHESEIRRITIKIQQQIFHPSRASG